MLYLSYSQLPRPTVSRRLDLVMGLKLSYHEMMIGIVRRIESPCLEAVSTMLSQSIAKSAYRDNVFRTTGILLEFFP